MPDGGSVAASSTSGPPLPARHVKRLAFGGLDLEPEYLMDRLRHECSELALPCQVQEVRMQGAEVMRMEVSSAGSVGSIPASTDSAAGGSSGCVKLLTEVFGSTFNSTDAATASMWLGEPCN